MKPSQERLSQYADAMLQLLRDPGSRSTQRLARNQTAKTGLFEEGARAVTAVDYSDPAILPSAFNHVHALVHADAPTHGLESARLLFNLFDLADPALFRSIQDLTPLRGMALMRLRWAQGVWHYDGRVAVINPALRFGMTTAASPEVADGYLLSLQLPDRGEQPPHRVELIACGRPVVDHQPA
jgi:hypothetical protein